MSESTPGLSVFRDAALDGPTNMARDECLLYDESIAPAALRIYEWTPPTISLGYFQKYDDIAGLPDELCDLSVVRRTTGGGAILHDREITYCLIADDSVAIARRPPAEMYRLVHEIWRDAIANNGGPELEVAPDSFPFPSPRSGPFFCFQKPGRTDLLIAGKKVLGSAQRRIAGHVMQHGSLLLGARFAAHPGGHLNDPPRETVERWIAAFVEYLADALQLERRRAAWTLKQLASADERRAKYSADVWTRRR